MKKKMITVSIGIPAYNEAANIKNMLEALLAQKQKSFVVKDITVISDASSDATDMIVTRMQKQSSVIKLLKKKQRKGKYFRVNQLFHLCKSDVQIILDADLAPVGDEFLEKLVTSLIADKSALMISAHAKLVQPDGFIARILHSNFILFDYMRLSVPNYDNAANFHGAATAYRGSFVRTVTIPEGLLDPHLYIYLCAKKQNGFRYSMDAVVLQNPPTTIHDVKQLMGRSIGKKDTVLEKMFGKEMIEQAHFIPKRAKYIGIMKSFMHQPFYTPLAIFISIYLGRVAHPHNVDKSPIWAINTSTKRPLRYAK